MKSADDHDLRHLLQKAHATGFVSTLERPAMSELIQGIGPRTVQETRSVTWITSAAAVLSAALTALFAVWAATGHDEVVLAGGQQRSTTANPVVGHTGEVDIDDETEGPTVRPAPSAPKAGAPTSKPVAATGAS